MNTGWEGLSAAGHGAGQSTGAGGAAWQVGAAGCSPWPPLGSRCSHSSGIFSGEAAHVSHPFTSLD